MNRYAATLLLILPFAAIADDAPAPEPRRYDGILSAGYAYGGNTLPDTQVANTGVATIRTGSGVYVSGGAMWKFSSRFALQGTVGYTAFS